MMTFLSGGDRGQVRLIIYDTIANIPVAGIFGRLFWATDENLLYYDTGAAWVELAQSLSTVDSGYLIKKLSFWDHFNRTAEDTDVWTAGGDGAFTFLPLFIAGNPMMWSLKAIGPANNDAYIHGTGIKNRAFTPHESDITTITWETQAYPSHLTNISVFVGLLQTIITDYTEPLVDCAHFIFDRAISANWLARTYDAAEEQTDTGVPVTVAIQTLKMVWTTAAVLFYIDDALVATHNTQVPDTPLISEVLVRTEHVADARYIYIDYINVEAS